MLLVKSVAGGNSHEQKADHPVFSCVALLLSGLGLLLTALEKRQKRAEAYRQEIACLESYFRPDDVFSEKNQEAARPFPTSGMPVRPIIVCS